MELTTTQQLAKAWLKDNGMKATVKQIDRISRHLICQQCGTWKTHCTCKELNG